MDELACESFSGGVSRVDIAVPALPVTLFPNVRIPSTSSLSVLKPVQAPDVQDYECEYTSCGA